MGYDVIIVGAGPGGLACAAITAEKGLKTLVLERKAIVGKKVCAGGVTWNGLVQRVPVELMEREWATQHVFTRLQKFSVSAPKPIIATVNRQKLGRRWPTRRGRQERKSGLAAGSCQLPIMSHFY